MDEIRLVIFDLAGTTIQDSGQVTEALLYVLNSHGFDITPETLLSLRGAAKREAIRSIAKEQADPIFHAFREHISEIYRKKGVTSIPGAAQTFEWLQNRKIAIALNTGFDRFLTDLILNSVGWNQSVIQTVVCGDDVPHGRPAPDLIFRAMKLAGVADKNRVANVGDTTRDLQAGQNAGVKWNIGVLSGAHTEEQLRKNPHTHLIPSVAELPSLWE